MSYHYTSFSKIRFYFFYVFYKVIVFHECKIGRIKIYKAEIFWFINHILKTNLAIGSESKTNYFETIFGKFTVPSDLLSTITVSPAFERLDINFVTNRIDQMLKKKHRVLFVDIGANFGLYSVLIGNKYKKRNVEIISFEPNTTYLTHPTYSLLKKNIEQNKIKKIELHKKGIGSKNTKNKNKIGISTVTLDSVLTKKHLSKYDCVVYKIDVDDYVIDVLKGCGKCIENSKYALLLVEDFVDKKSINLLAKKYSFVAKLTSYNSFWEKK